MKTFLEWILAETNNIVKFDPKLAKLKDDKVLQRFKKGYSKAVNAFKGKDVHPDFFGIGFGIAILPGHPYKWNADGDWNFRYAGKKFKVAKAKSNNVVTHTISLAA